MGGERLRIRIGGQTSFAASAITAPFEYAVEHGFDAFEWFPDRRTPGQGWAESDLTPHARLRIAQQARRHDVALSVHASLDASLLTPSGRERLSSQMDLASEIGAGTFVIHLDRAVDPGRYLDAATDLAASLGSADIRLAIENTPCTAPGDFNDLFGRLYARSTQGGTRSAPAVGVCLDVGHANLCGATRNDYLAWVDRLSDAVEISHVHLHENWGDTDSHLPLFTGPAAHDDTGIAGLVDRLVRRRFAGCIILEQWPEPPSLLDEARARLHALFAARHPGPTRARRSGP